MTGLRPVSAGGAPEQKPLVRPSMLKRVDTAVHDAIAEEEGGFFTGGAGEGVRIWPRTGSKTPRRQAPT